MRETAITAGGHEITDVHWDHLKTRVHLAGWAQARQIGLTVEQCDAITEAALNAVRQTLEQWATEEDES